MLMSFAAFLMVFGWVLFMAFMALQENSSTAIKKTLDQLNDYRIISEDGQSRVTVWSQGCITFYTTRF